MVYPSDLTDSQWGKTKGRNRHIATDIMGHFARRDCQRSNIHDTVAGGEVLKKALKKYPILVSVCADAGYRKPFETAVAELGLSVDISERIKPEGR